MYLSKDPIGLAGNNPTLYGYVKDTNSWVDQFGLELITANPNDINYSQRTVSEVRVFDADKYKPIRVMCVEGQLVSYDNRRLLSAQNAGIESIEVELVKGNDIMPGSKKTWNEAFQKRFNDPRNIEAGGAIPNKGLKEKPLPCH
jgi:regulatory protein YycH of two-component signal transduction system YycFG